MQFNTKMKSQIEETFIIPSEINDATLGLKPEFRTKLLKMLNQENAVIIAKYILSMKYEINLSDNYRKSIIRILSKLSNFTNKSKPFIEITHDDLLSFLDSYRKPEGLDTLHKWIGTYNNLLVICSRFFKWLYYPDINPRDRVKPPVIQNLKLLPRKEKSIYKPTDLWSQDDDQLFLRYIPSIRDKCYHTVARDTACRPHEILGIKVKDIDFKMAGDRQYAEILVNGKTGSRSIPLINSIPYVKDWIDSHPQKTNLNAYLIFAMGKSMVES